MLESTPPVESTEQTKVEYVITLDNGQKFTAKDSKLHYKQVIRDIEEGGRFVFFPTFILNGSHYGITLDVNHIISVEAVLVIAGNG
jgi:hypothetical protein